MHGGNGVAGAAAVLARNPAALLTGALQSIFGAALVGLWIGEDMIVDGSNNVTSWPGRVGQTLSPLNAGYYRIAGTINGRKSSTATGLGTARTLKAPTSFATVPASCLCVAAGKPTLPNESLVHSIGQGNPLMADGTVPANIYLGNGTPHYVNGVASEVFADGLQILEATNSSGTNKILYFGGSSVDNRNWQKELCLGAMLSSAIDATQRAQSTAALKFYYSIP